MLVTTILNKVEKHKGFVYEKARMVRDGADRWRIEVTVRPRRNGRARCSVCGQPAPCYDRLQPRRFRYVPVLGLAVLLVYTMRRVDCVRCGVKVEWVPWSTGKSPVTRALALYLADWAKVLSWQEVGRRFGVSWHRVFESVRYVVDWGLAHRDLSGVTAIGIDEVHFGKGQKYLTVVYQLCGDVRRLLFITPGHDRAALSGLLDEMGPTWCAGITHVCTDMWKAYRTVIEKRLLNALHILDRFHIVKLLNEAVDQVRRQEAARLRKQGIDLLKGLRYVFLKRPENLTAHREQALHKVIRKHALATVRAYRWSRKFQLFWEYTSPFWARRYLRKWCQGAMHSRLEPLKKFVRTMRRHEDLTLNWFVAKKVCCLNGNRSVAFTW